MKIGTAGRRRSSGGKKKMAYNQIFKENAISHGYWFFLKTVGVTSDVCGSGRNILSLSIASFFLQGLKGS